MDAAIPDPCDPCGSPAFARRAGSAPPDPHRAPRGVALLLVIVSIAVVTALALDLAYNTRVSVQMAANARDELQAYYLAKSGVNIARFVLHFQQQMDSGMQALASLPGGAQAAPMSFGVRLWDIVPLDSSLLGFFGGGEDADPDKPREGFGTFDGSFKVHVGDEDRKINLRQFDALDVYKAVQAARLAELIRDPKWDFLFDRPDANGIQLRRRDLLGAIKDWIDGDETGSTYVPGAQTPFENSYADENAYYDRLPDPYKAKNAPFDSLSELYMVAGVSDAFMAAFGDRLTVYPGLNATVDVNTSDPQELLADAVAMGGGVIQPVMLEPTFLDQLKAGMKLFRPASFMTIDAIQFAQLLEALGVQVAPQYQSAANVGVSNAFDQRATTFRIRATGHVGGVTKQIEAIVLFDSRALGLERDLGRLVHWDEE